MTIKITTPKSTHLRSLATKKNFKKYQKLRKVTLHPCGVSPALPTRKFLMTSSSKKVPEAAFQPATLANILCLSKQ